MSLYLEPVSSALSEAAEWGRVGVSEGGLGVYKRQMQQLDLTSLPHSPGSGQAARNRATGKKQIVKCAPIVGRCNSVADALGKLQDY